MAKIYLDISQTITPSMVVYPGDPPVKIEDLLSIERGNIANVSNITMGTHTGTHIDAPKHFYDRGLTIDSLLLDYLIGPAKVFEFKDCPAISRADLESCGIKKDDIIILKTRNSTLLSKSEFDPTYTYLESEAAEYLAEIGVKTLGIDYLTIDPYGNSDFKAHYTLLGKNIIIIEGLNLNMITPGEYQLVALPLKIKGGNGSPARVVLIKEV